MMNECQYCGGSGSVDSGGFTPWGYPIDVPCTECNQLESQMPIQPEAICEDCRFFKPTENGPEGECRRHAPLLIRSTDGHIRHAWPLLFPGEFCGEFQPKQPDLRTASDR